MAKAIILIILIMALLSNASAAYGSDWPLFKRDASNTGITPDRIPENPIVLLSADIQRMETTPTIFSGLVYALTGNGSIYAMSLDEGELKWQSQLEGWVYQMSSLACSDDNLFAATDSGLLASFDALNGEELWKRNLTDKRFESTLNYIEGQLYLGEGSAYGKGEKRFYCFDREGIERWNISRNTSGYQWCGATKSGDYVVFGQNHGLLLSANRANGQVADELSLNDRSRLSFSQKEPGRVRSSVAFAGGYAYLTSELSAQEGFAWKIGLNDSIGRFEDHGWSSPVGFSTSTPSIHDGRVYLGMGEHGHPGALVCLDDYNGELIWSYPVEAGVKSSPAVSTATERPRILFTTSTANGSVYCLEDGEKDGELLWRFPFRAAGDYAFGFSPVYSNGHVFFSSEKTYCLDALDGKEIWNISCNNSLCGSAAIKDGMVYMSTYNFNGQGDLLSISLLWRAKISPTDCTPAVAEGLVYLCGGCDGFSELVTYCFDATSGEILWMTRPEERIGDWRCSPAYADGLLFVGRADYTDYQGLYALNASTGTVAWSHLEGGSSPAIADGVVYTVGGGRVYAFADSDIMED